MSVELLHAAIRYAHAGHPVFPLKPRQKVPAGHLVPHGVKDATTDVAVIERWWDYGLAGYNIGLATGYAADVLDVDDVDAFDRWVGVHGVDVFSCAAYCVTGSGGRHLYWVAEPGGNRTKHIPGCDWRGLGGYVVAPPSTHPNGEPYTWRWCNWSKLTPAPPEVRASDYHDPRFMAGAKRFEDLSSEELRSMPAWQRGIEMLDSDDLLANLGDRIVGKPFLDAVCRREIEQLSAVDRERNKAIYECVKSLSRLRMHPDDLRQLVSLVQMIGEKLPHRTDPDLKSAREVRATIGSALYRRACLTLGQESETT